VSILDWVLAAILILGAFRGLRRGLVRSLAHLAGLVLGLVLAWRFSEPLCRYLEAHYGWVSRLGAYLAAHLPLAMTVSSLPVGQGNALNDAIGALGLPAFVKAYLAAAGQNLAGLPPGLTVGQVLSTLLAAALISAACFTLIFFAVQTAAAALGGSLSGALALTPLHFVDHLLGAAAGAATTAVFLTLAVGGLSLLASVPAFAFIQPFLARSQLVPTFLWLFRHLVPNASRWFGLS